MLATGGYTGTLVAMLAVSVIIVLCFWAAAFAAHRTAG
jgi:hypothetical protein